MSRLIDADELERAVMSMGEDAVCDDCAYEFVNLIDAQPTIEAEPVRYGHWNGWTATHWTRKYDDNGDPIYKEHTYYACSGCRRRSIIKSAYCPACGRMMLEETERG